MRNLIYTMVISLYEGLSLALEFAPMKVLTCLVSKEWFITNDLLLTRAIHVNMLFAIIMLGLLCYSQGVEDEKHNKK